MVTSFLVTGDWRTLTEDGPDEDPYPDEVPPTGHVRFVPTDPGPYLVDGVAHTLSPVTGLIAAGGLRDLQGRDGLHLTAQVGDEPIEWAATIHLPRYTYTIHFTPTGDTHLTGGF